MKRFLSLFCVFMILLTSVSGCGKKSTPPELSKCLNIGNSLDSPKGENWGVPMDISYFSLIKNAGFSCVRLPVRISDYVDRSTTDYTIDPTLLKNLDSYIKEAQANHLTIILDLHLFTEIMKDPNGNKACLIAIWKQLATRYKNYSDTLVFEVLNEPQDKLDSDTWNSILADTVKAIRAIDTKHYLIVGGANYNSIDGLLTLKLPKDDKLIATFHYYEPNKVCFQGVPNLPGYTELSNVTWNGTTEEISYLKSRLQTAKDWADKNHVPLFMGEFGVSQGAPESTRLSWTSAVTNEASTLGISYGYWEFASFFGLYNLSTKTWNTELLNAILNPVTP